MFPIMMRTWPQIIRIAILVNTHQTPSKTPPESLVLNLFAAEVFDCFTPMPIHLSSLYTCIYPPWVVYKFPIYILVAWF